MISYKSMTSDPSECVNLLVPVCLSASHIAYGSIRMEPVFMALGKAAGVAASMAAKDAVEVQQIDVQKLIDSIDLELAVKSVDVPTGYWAENAIYKIYDGGITTGCSKNPLKYCPEDPVTRAQMAIFLLRSKHGNS